MTKTEAFILSLNKGAKITHRYFSDDEWIIVLPGYKVQTEEGYIFPLWEFMQLRQSPEWENDWELVEII